MAAESENQRLQRLGVGPSACLCRAGGHGTLQGRACPEQRLVRQCLTCEGDAGRQSAGCLFQHGEPAKDLVGKEDGAERRGWGRQKRMGQTEEDGCSTRAREKRVTQASISVCVGNSVGRGQGDDAEERSLRRKRLALSPAARRISASASSYALSAHRQRARPSTHLNRPAVQRLRVIVLTCVVEQVCGSGGAGREGGAWIPVKPKGPLRTSMRRSTSAGAPTAPSMPAHAYVHIPIRPCRCPPCGPETTQCDGACTAHAPSMHPQAPSTQPSNVPGCILPATPPTPGRPPNLGAETPTPARLPNLSVGPQRLADCQTSALDPNAWQTAKPQRWTPTSAMTGRIPLQQQDGTPGLFSKPTCEF
eukprot:352030-Chlamydomonas_euryale.AAC.3